MDKQQLIDYIKSAPVHLLSVENLVSVSGKTRENIQRHFWVYVEQRLNPTVPVSAVDAMIKPLLDEIERLRVELTNATRQFGELEGKLKETRRDLSEWRETCHRRWCQG